MTKKETTTEKKTVVRKWRISNVFHDIDKDGKLLKTYLPNTPYVLSDEKVKEFRKIKTVWICCNGPISSKKEAEDCNCK